MRRSAQLELGTVAPYTSGKLRSARKHVFSVANIKITRHSKSVIEKSEIKTQIVGNHFLPSQVIGNGSLTFA